MPVESLADLVSVNNLLDPCDRYSALAPARLLWQRPLPFFELPSGEVAAWGDGLWYDGAADLAAALYRALAPVLAETQAASGHLAYDRGPYVPSVMLTVYYDDFGTPFRRLAEAAGRMESAGLRRALRTTTTTYTDLNTKARTFRYALTEDRKR